MLSLFIISCSDDSSTSPVVVKPQKAFTWNEGDVFILQNSKGELCSLIVRSTQMRQWAMNFWDTATKVNLNSIIFEKKTYNASIAQYDEFALAATDSGYMFGSANNPLIDKNYQLEYISYRFFIPHDFSKVNNESVNKNMKLGDLAYDVSFSAIWSNAENVYFPKDTLRKSYNVKYSAKRTIYIPGNTGEDYIISSGLGFYRFWDYYLIKKI